MEHNQHLISAWPYPCGDLTATEYPEGRVRSVWTIEHLNVRMFTSAAIFQLKVGEI